MEELARVISQVGMDAFWAVVIYKLIDFAELVFFVGVMWVGVQQGIKWLKNNPF